MNKDKVGWKRGKALPVTPKMHAAFKAKMEERIRVLKISFDGLKWCVIPESRKEDFWAHAADWECTATVKFATMTRDEFEALPEFDGY